MGNSNEVGWEEAVWKEINDAVLVEMGKVRAAQKGLPTTSFLTKPANVISPAGPTTDSCSPVSDE